MKPGWQHRVIVLGWVVVGLLSGARLISNFLSNLGYIDLVEVALTSASAKGMVVRYNPPGVTDETRLGRGMWVVFTHQVPVAYQRLKISLWDGQRL